MSLPRSEALVHRRGGTAESSQIRALGADADGKHVALVDHRLDRHLEVGELLAQPCDDLPERGTPQNTPGFRSAKRLHSMLDVALGDDLLDYLGTLAREDLLEQTPDRTFSSRDIMSPSTATPPGTRGVCGPSATYTRIREQQQVTEDTIRGS